MSLEVLGVTAHVELQFEAQPGDLGKEEICTDATVGTINADTFNRYSSKHKVALALPLAEHAL
jgi:hypothetical protein